MTEIGLLTRSMEVLVLCDSCCNDPHITELNLVNYPHLSLIDIGNNCFEHVTRVHLQQLPKLDSFSVGWKCFYHINTNGEFLMSGCDRLLQIHIGLWSFNEYSLFSIESRVISHPTILRSALSYQSYNDGVEFSELLSTAER